MHHYTTPIADIQLVKYDDFQLWVTDVGDNPAAVAPVAQRGSGDASASTCSTPRPGRSSPRKSNRLTAPIPR